MRFYNKNEKSNGKNLLGLSHLSQSALKMSPTVEKSSARNIDVSYKPSAKKVIYPNSIIKKDMFIDTDEMDYVLGKAMFNADRLKEMYDVEITLLFKGNSQIIISLEGLAEDVFAAKRDIEECMPLTARFFIEKDSTV